jgi:hypothetical protein
MNRSHRARDPRYSAASTIVEAAGQLEGWQRMYIGE